MAIAKGRGTVRLVASALTARLIFAVHHYITFSLCEYFAVFSNKWGVNSFDLLS